VTVINTMLPLLRKSASGRIANISSSLGSIASLSNPEAPIWQYANLLAYNSSKAALNAITSSTRNRCGPRGSRSTRSTPDTWPPTSTTTPDT
jgi:NAD(P)-dependent dehydrogenase (short-subunit alcohol dehydrogenase family)